ncbi:MAG: PD-(D/E)XK nuclease family protein [Firmicutes bacterium]|nr:PD-(D/E)XK nuclease family protein [Bacillota bacterium]
MANIFKNYIECFEEVKNILSKRKVSLDETHFVVTEEGVTSAVERLLFSMHNHQPPTTNHQLTGAFDIEVVSFPRLFYKLKERYEVQEGSVLDIVPLNRSGAIMLLKKVVFENIDKIKVFARSVKFSGFFEVLYDTILQLSMHNEQNTIDDKVLLKNSTDYKLWEIWLISELFFAECQKHKYVDKVGQLQLLKEIAEKLDLKNMHFYFVGIDEFSGVEGEIVKMLEKRGKGVFHFESTSNHQSLITNHLTLMKSSDEHDLIKSIASRIRHNLICGMKFSDMAVAANADSHDRIKRIFSEYDILFHLDEKLIVSEQELARFVLSVISNQRSAVSVEDNFFGNSAITELQITNHKNIKSFVEEILTIANAEKKSEELSKICSIDLTQVPKKMLETVQMCVAITDDFSLQKKLFTEGLMSQKISLVPKTVDMVEIGGADNFLGNRYKEIFVLNFSEENYFFRKKDLALSNKDLTKLGIEKDDLKDIEREEKRLKTVLGQSEKVFLTILDGSDEEPFVKELKESAKVVENRSAFSDDFLFKNNQSAINDQQSLNTIYEILSHEARGVEIALLSEKAIKDGERGVFFHGDLIDALEGRVEEFEDTAKERFLFSTQNNSTTTDNKSPITNPQNNNNASFDILHSSLKTISASRLETYFSCPLKAFLRYSLNLKKTEKDEIQPYETGNFLHEVMEKVLGNRDWGTGSSDDEIEKRVREICQDILEKDERLKKILKKGQEERLINEAVRLAKILIKQVEKGAFVPTYFEKKLSEFEKPLEFLTHDEGVRDLSAHNAQRTMYNDSQIAGMSNANPNKFNNDKSGFELFSSASTITNHQPLTTSHQLKGTIDRIDLFHDPKTDKTYARIIDYKTGKREKTKFSFKELYYGKKVQLALYAKVLLENGFDIAGIFYFPLNAGVFNDDETDFRLEGIYSNNADILNAHDIALSIPLSESSVIRAATKKDGTLNKNKSRNAFSKEEFKKIIDYSFKVCKQAVNEMNEGRFEVKPLKDECLKCDYKDVCLGAEKKEREMKSVSGKDILQGFSTHLLE